jgi:hypothetical protein
MTSDPITSGPTQRGRGREDHAAEPLPHIPIVEDERTIGIVSIRDVARWSTEED